MVAHSKHDRENLMLDKPQSGALAPATFADETPLVKLQQVSVRRGARAILSGVDLTVRPGEIVTVIGPNGGGKSTLLKIVLGLVKPDAGQVTTRPALRVGYVPQRLQ